jgi:hypothetical protein
MKTLSFKERTDMPSLGSAKDFSYIKAQQL